MATVTSGRSWTRLGTLAGAGEALVDSRGLVVRPGSTWSLDWWVGAADRWHHPSHEASARQRLVDLTPVVETAIGVPGGDALHRAFAIRPMGRDDDLLVVEVENRSRAPFALALVVRPVDGVAAGKITLVEHTVDVGGIPAVRLPGTPAGTVAAGAGADLEALVAAGRPHQQLNGHGVTQAAFIYPLAHSATLRLCVPLQPFPARRAVVNRRRDEQEPLPSTPSAADAARAWQAQTRRGMRVELPPGRLADAVAANRRFLLVLHAGRAIGGPGSDPVTAHASLLVALGQWGFHREADELALTLAARQHADGQFSLSRTRARQEEPAATGAVLWAIAEQHRLTGDSGPVGAIVGAVARGADWVDRARHSRHRRTDPARIGLPPGTYADACWSLKGLLDSAELLRAAGEEAAAATAAGCGRAFRRDLEASLAVVAGRLGDLAIPIGPGRETSAPSLGALHACCTLGLYPPTHPVMARTLEAVRSSWCDGGTRRSPEATLQLAAVELVAGDHRALERLAWAVDSASDTYTWPVHDVATSAGFCSLVRNLLARETPDGLDVCTALPDTWMGQNLEVHDAPTSAGLLSFAVRWHADRPVLLWELRGRRAEPVRLRAPGLDRRWSSRQPSGEVLLAGLAPSAG
jgi:hypothetical protein